MTSLELSEWMAFSRIEPFGAQVEDLRLASLMALMTNLLAPSKEKTWDPLDFMPDYDDSVSTARDQQLIGKIRGFQQEIAVRQNRSKVVQEKIK